VLPWVIGFLAFTAGPMLYSLYLAFTGLRRAHPAEMGWRGQLRERADQRPAVLAGPVQPAYYVSDRGSALPGGIIPRRIGGQPTDPRRQLFTARSTNLPSITPAVASSILWLMIFQSDFGLVNSLLSSIGLPTRKWLFDPQVTKLVFVVMGFWGIGSSMVTFLAGLQSISEALYDAAAIDGRWRLGALSHVTPTDDDTVDLFQPDSGDHRQLSGVLPRRTSSPAAVRPTAPSSTCSICTTNGWQFLKMGLRQRARLDPVPIILGFTTVQFKLADRGFITKAACARRHRRLKHGIGPGGMTGKVDIIVARRRGALAAGRTALFAPRPDWPGAADAHAAVVDDQHLAFKSDGAESSIRRGSFRQRSRSTTTSRADERDCALLPEFTFLVTVADWTGFSIVRGYAWRGCAFRNVTSNPALIGHDSLPVTLIDFILFKNLGWVNTYLPLTVPTSWRRESTSSWRQFSMNIHTTSTRGQNRREVREIWWRILCRFRARSGNGRRVQRVGQLE